MTEQELYQMTPQQLTEKMLQGLVFQYEQAITAIEAKAFDHMNDRLQKAYALLTKLSEGLHDDGGIITSQLEALYFYLGQQTLRAYTEHHVLTEALFLAEELLVTWQAASTNKRPIARAAHHAGYERMAYE